jgi:hypothetical protein
MILAGAESLREVIPFPKTAAAKDLMMEAPTPVAEAQLRELALAHRLTPEFADCSACNAKYEVFAFSQTGLPWENRGGVAEQPPDCEECGKPLVVAYRPGTFVRLRKLPDGAAGSRRPSRHA